MSDITQRDRYQFIRDTMWMNMVTMFDLEIDYDKEGDQWIFSDTAGMCAYGVGGTPQEALDDYVRAVQTHVELEANHIEENT